MRVTLTRRAEPTQGSVYRHNPINRLVARQTLRYCRSTMSEARDVIIVYCTVPDTDTGQRIASHLVEYGLAACVNLIPGVTSVYRWKGQVQTDTEALLMIKAREVDYARLETAIRSQHPYELPEIIAVSLTAGLTEYLDWVRTSNNEAP
jgi:periplasmic divalent cation tolerance protein